MREIQSLARGLQIIDLIVNSETTLSTTEIAAQLEVDKSTASRLIKTLQKYEYIQQQNGSRGYMLGKRLHSIGWQVTNRFALREIAEPFLHNLLQQTNESAHVGVYSAGKALITDDLQPEHSMLRVVGNSGRLIYLHNTAIGKSLIAFGDYPLPTDLPQMTPQTIISTDALHAELAAVRQRGFAIDQEENEFGVCCIAAPIFNAIGVTVASIGISGPTVRVHGERIRQLGDLVKQTADRLSTELGFDGSAPT